MATQVSRRVEQDQGMSMASHQGELQVVDGPGTGVGDEVGKLHSHVEQIEQ